MVGYPWRDFMKKWGKTIEKEHCKATYIKNKRM
jgi:hypothetical protein